MTDTLTQPGPDEASHTAPDLIERTTVDLGGVLESIEELSDYLEKVVHTVRAYIDGCDEVGVTILSDDRAHTAAYSTVHTLDIDATQYALDEGPCLDAARTGEEQHVGDVVHDDGRWPQFAKASREEGMRALYAVPLASGGQCVGALNLYAWAPHAFDGFDATIARVAAARCADAVISVSRIDGLRRLTGQLEQAMASRAVIEQAKGVIMAMRGIPEYEAFEVLRKTSQDRNIKVRVLAEQVIRDVTLPDGSASG